VEQELSEWSPSVMDLSSLAQLLRQCITDQRHVSSSGLCSPHARRRCAIAGRDRSCGAQVVLRTAAADSARDHCAVSGQGLTGDGGREHRSADPPKPFGHKHCVDVVELGMPHL
jgi:hypothetical protein